MLSVRNLLIVFLLLARLTPSSFQILPVFLIILTSVSARGAVTSVKMLFSTVNSAGTTTSPPGLS